MSRNKGIFRGIDIVHMSIEDVDKLGIMYKRGVCDGMIVGARWCLESLRNGGFGDMEEFDKLDKIVNDFEEHRYV